MARRSARERVLMTEDERVAGEARVNVQGTCVEPVGDGFRDRGSLLVAVAESGELAPRPARRTDRRGRSACASLAGTVPLSVLSALWLLRDCAGNGWDRKTLASWASCPRRCRILGAGMIAQR